MFKTNLQAAPLRAFQIPPTAVGGLFRSSLRRQSPKNSSLRAESQRVFKN